MSIFVDVSFLDKAHIKKDTSFLDVYILDQFLKLITTLFFDEFYSSQFELEFREIESEKHIYRRGKLFKTKL